MSATTTTTRAASRKQTNAIPIRPLALWLLAVFVIGTAALCYVRIKNQQHVLGERTRQIERRLAEVTSENQALRAQIRSLTSHSALNRRLKDGFIALIPIADRAIARASKPGMETARAEVTRTASAERVLR